MQTQGTSPQWCWAHYTAACDLKGRRASRAGGGGRVLTIYLNPVCLRNGCYVPPPCRGVRRHCPGDLGQRRAICFHQSNVSHSECITSQQNPYASTCVAVRGSSRILDTNYGYKDSQSCSVSRDGSILMRESTLTPRWKSCALGHGNSQGNAVCPPALHNPQPAMTCSL